MARQVFEEEAITWEDKLNRINVSSTCGSTCRDAGSTWRGSSGIQMSGTENID
jgi:hypothetical protein